MSIEHQILRAPLVQSVDWRFLLPLSQNDTVLFVGDQSNELKKAFEELGVPAATWPTISPAEISSDLRESTFNIVAVPYGMASDRRQGQSDRIAIYRTVRPLLKPGGVLLLGFTNVFLGNENKIPAARPGQIRRMLRSAGYVKIDFYGVYPNLMIPEYIFPLKFSPFLFTMDFHLRNRLPGTLLRILSNRIVFVGISNLIPAYFAVAKT